MTIHSSTAAAFDGIESSGLLEPPVAKPLTGDIPTWTRELFASADAAASSGFWQAGPGTSYWDFADYTEAIYIIEGTLVATETGQEPVTLGPGDAAVFPVGWKGEWNAPTGLKKFYVTFP